MSATVVELDRVTRRFGDLVAVDEVSLTVQRGEIVGLLGHNGAGKTTLIRVINGLLSPHGGRVRVHGLDPATHGSEVRRRSGVLTEYPALDTFLTARENLEVYAAICGVAPAVAAERIRRLLSRLGLQDKRDEQAGRLSAGLKQRVALARGLVHSPELLLLDEPTTNMDPLAAREVRDLIRAAVREEGGTVLLSTHNLAEAEELCDRVAILREGRLLRLGPPAVLRRELGRVDGIVLSTDPARLSDLTALMSPNGTQPHRHATVLDDHRVEVTGDVEVEAVVAEVVRAGIPVRGAEPLRPTLEDLYVALHGHEEVAASLQGPAEPPSPAAVTPASTAPPNTAPPSADAANPAVRSTAATPPSLRGDE